MPEPTENSFIGGEYLTIRGKEVGYHIPLSPQVLHDLKINYRENLSEVDRALQRGLINLNTILYKSDVQSEIKEVPFKKNLIVRIPIDMIIYQYLFTSIGMIALYDQLNPLIVALIVLSNIIPTILAVIGFKKTINGKVEINREEYYTFPDNQNIFPDSLGEPKLQRVYNAKVKYD